MPTDAAEHGDQFMRGQRVLDGESGTRYRVVGLPGGPTTATGWRELADLVQQGDKQGCCVAWQQEEEQ
jgi:hypothetical protein